MKTFSICKIISAFKKGFERTFSVSHPKGPQEICKEAAKYTKTSESFVKKLNIENFDDNPGRNLSSFTSEDTDKQILLMLFE